MEIEVRRVRDQLWVSAYEGPVSAVQSWDVDPLLAIRTELVHDLRVRGSEVVSVEFGATLLRLIYDSETAAEHEIALVRETVELNLPSS